MQEDEVEEGHDSVPEKILAGKSVSVNTFQRDFDLR